SRREPTIRHSPRIPPPRLMLFYTASCEIGMAVSILPAGGPKFGNGTVVRSGTITALNTPCHGEISLCDRPVAEYIQVAESWQNLPSALWEGASYDRFSRFFPHFLCRVHFRAPPSVAGCRLAVFDQRARAAARGRPGPGRSAQVGQRRAAPGQQGDRR